jgi:hypothetical protein
MINILFTGSMIQLSAIWSSHEPSLRWSKCWEDWEIEGYLRLPPNTMSGEHSICQISNPHCMYPVNSILIITWSDLICVRWSECWDDRDIDGYVLLPPDTMSGYHFLRILNFRSSQNLVILNSIWIITQSDLIRLRWSECWDHREIEGHPRLPPDTMSGYHFSGCQISGHYMDLVGSK